MTCRLANSSSHIWWKSLLPFIAVAFHYTASKLIRHSEIRAHATVCKTTIAGKRSHLVLHSFPICDYTLRCTPGCVADDSTYKPD